MKLKNYQEDVVLRAIEIALEQEPDLLADEDFVKDVAAYVLNRVPARYVMSERGFLRLALEHFEEDQQEKSLANVIELMMLVNRGVDLVRDRRSEPQPSSLRSQTDVSGADGGTIEYVHNYPQIIGRVIDDQTGEPVYGATVTLLVDGRIVPPAANGWQNPYVTRRQTRGHFSFWPRSSRNTCSEHSVEFQFTVSREGYHALHDTRRVTTEGSYDAAQTIHGDKILSLHPLAIRPTIVTAPEAQ